MRDATRVCVLVDHRIITPGACAARGDVVAAAHHVLDRQLDGLEGIIRVFFAISEPF